MLVISKRLGHERGSFLGCSFPRVGRQHGGSGSPCGAPRGTGWSLSTWIPAGAAGTAEAAACAGWGCCPWRLLLPPGTLARWLGQRIEEDHLCLSALGLLGLCRLDPGGHCLESPLSGLAKPQVHLAPGLTLPRRFPLKVFAATPSPQAVCLFHRNVARFLRAPELSRTTGLPGGLGKAVGGSRSFRGAFQEPCLFPQVLLAAAAVAAEGALLGARIHGHLGIHSAPSKCGPLLGSFLCLCRSVFLSVLVFLFPFVEPRRRCRSQCVEGEAGVEGGKGTAAGLRPGEGECRRRHRRGRAGHLLQLGRLGFGRLQLLWPLVSRHLR